MSEVFEAAGLSLGISAASVAIAAAVGLPLAVALGLSQSRLAESVLFVARLGMAVPTVVVGLVVYGMLSRHGPFGPLGLLYTPQAIVLGEVMLGFPMVLALGAAAVRGLDPRFFDALRTMGATMFARLAGKYCVGVSTEKDRPHGRRAIVLDRDLVADLTAGVSDEDLPADEQTERPAEGPASFYEPENDGSYEPTEG